MNRKSLLVAVGLLCAVAAARAQQSDDASMLYRGRAATLYYTVYNGTYFWDSPGFKDGSVFYSGRLYEGVRFNVNADEQSLVVGLPDMRRSITPQSSQVAWFVMDGRQFVNLPYYGYKEAPEWFYEVLYNGQGVTLFSHVHKHLSTAQGDHNGKEIGYEDPNYNHNLLTFFDRIESFWVLKDGGLFPVKSRKEMLKLFPEHKRAIKRYTRDHMLNSIDVPMRTWLIAAMAQVGGIQMAYEPQPKPFGGDLVSGGESYGTAAGVPQAPYTGPVMKTLPGGYFAEEGASRQSEAMKYLNESNIIASFRNKVYQIGSKTSGQKSATVRGYVTDVSTGEALPGVSVSDGTTYVMTDKNGYYQITLKSGDHVLTFQEYSKEDMNMHVILHGDGSFDVPMKDKTTMLDEAMVSAESRAGHRTSKIGVEKVDIKTIAKIPAAFGEGDIIKAVLTLPGVKSTGDASTGFNVRGGSTDQNLILFNEGTIYNPSHMFGVFSAFNTDVVDKVELYKSSIPVEFGGRISSVLDVQGRNGNPEKVQGSLGLGILTSHFHLEGPIAKGKTTFVLGARTTYSDWILKNLPASSGYSNGSAGFSDANLGITHYFNERNSLTANAYWSRDRFAFSGDTSFRYSNLNASLKWMKLIGAHSTMAFTVGYDSFGNILDDTGDEMQAYQLETGIQQAFAKLSFKTRMGAHSLSYGAHVIGYGLARGDMMPLGDSSLVAARSLGVEKALEPSLWLGDIWQPNDQLSVEGGVRLASFISTGDRAAKYVNPELRLSAKYSFNPDFSLKAGFNTMTQYIHLVTNTSSISPMDTWKLCDADLSPQQGWQVAAGAYKTFLNGKVDVSLEGYYKRMHDYLDYKSGAMLTMNEHIADALVPTYGKAYGAELMVRKTVGELTGWVSYTWSRTMLREMEDRGLSTINRGEWYNAPHDKPHDVKMVANYKFTHRYSMSLNLDYSTGRPVTLPVGKYYYGGGYRLAYSDRNAYRIPDYFRMDLGLNIEPGHYLKKLTHMSFTLGCYNVTGRKNAYSVFFTTNGGQLVQGYMLSVFATQIPYVTLNLKF